MKSSEDTAKRATPVTWGGFFIWVMIGAGAAIGFLSLGTLAIVAVVLVVGIASSRPALRRSWFGVLAGIGATLLFIAFMQRHGPGTVCWQTATASGCDEYLNPLPWLVMGLTLVAIGVIAHARRKREAAST